MATFLSGLTCLSGLICARRSAPISAWAMGMDDFDPSPTINKPSPVPFGTRSTTAWHDSDGLAGVEQPRYQGSGRALVLGLPNRPWKSDAKRRIEVVRIDLIQADGVAEIIDGHFVLPEALQ